MFFHEIVLALKRVEERQKLILERLKALEDEKGKVRGDEWLQSGIDSILAFEAGKKKEGQG